MEDSKLTIRYRVHAKLSRHTEQMWNMTASDAAEALLMRYEDHLLDPENYQLYLYIDSTREEAVDDLFFFDNIEEPLDINEYMNTYSLVHIVTKMYGEDEELKHPRGGGVYQDTRATFERLIAIKESTPNLEYAKIRYRVMPEWKELT